MSEKKVNAAIDQKRPLARAFYLLGFVTREKGGKRYLLVKTINSIVSVLFPVVYAILPGMIINELSTQMRIKRLVIYVLVLLVLPLVQHFLATVFDIHLKKDMDNISRHANERIFSHSIDMDYENYEKPEYNVLRDRVHSTMWNLGSTADHVISFFASLTSIVALAFIITTLNVWIVLLTGVIVVINSILTRYIDKKKFKYDKEQSKWNNYNWVYRNSLVYNWNMKDVRLFNLKELLIESWSNITKKENLASEKSFNLGYIPASCAAILNFVQQLFIYVFVIGKVINGQMEIGTMTILLSSASMFASRLSEIARNYLNIANDGLHVDEVKQFINLPHNQLSSGNKKPTFDRESIIEFRNVSFKYPGSEIYALKDLNLTFRGNEKLCIVGNNGAGKTTFIKLLTRLYFPTSGEILLNGISIYEYDLASYQRLFAPVFQDGGAFNFTIGKNITLANAWDDSKVDSIVFESGLKNLIDKQPQKYETQIGKWLDEGGIDLSGGEEQRFKIARAIYHGGDIYLLDEPTSSLDPVAEYNIYMQFDKMTEGKAAILITHRLAAVHLADKIAVFGDGKVVEYGSHKELYNAGGYYTEMFDKQSEFYKKTSES